jgi:hypothetical protein
MGKFRGATPTKPSFSSEKSLPVPVSTNDLKPVFSFEHMLDASGYSANCCPQAEGAQLVGKLFTIGKMTWGEINQSSRHGLGTEIIGTEQIKAKLPAAVTDDVRLLAFRYNGKKPMVGYREDRVFHVLYVDHDFTLYDH